MAASTAVRLRSVVDAKALRNKLRIPPAIPGGSETIEKQIKAELERVLMAAKRKADSFCNQDFGGGDIPEEVEDWVLARAASLYVHPIEGEYEHNDAGYSVKLQNKDGERTVDYSRISHLRIIPGF